MEEIKYNTIAGIHVEDAQDPSWVQMIKDQPGGAKYFISHPLRPDKGVFGFPVGDADEGQLLLEAETRFEDMGLDPTIVTIFKVRG